MGLRTLVSTDWARMTEDEAREIATRVLSGAVRSYVQEARALAQYILSFPRSTVQTEYRAPDRGMPGEDGDG